MSSKRSRQCAKGLDTSTRPEIGRCWVRLLLIGIGKTRAHNTHTLSTPAAACPAAWLMVDYLQQCVFCACESIGNAVKTHQPHVGGPWFFGAAWGHPTCHEVIKNTLWAVIWFTTKLRTSGSHFFLIRRKLCAEAWFSVVVANDLHSMT